MENILAITVVLALSAIPALAQERGPLVELTDGDASISVLGLAVDQTVGKEVYDREGTLLGTVGKVLGDDADTPIALTVGGGGRIVVLELASTELINNRIVTQLSGNEYEGLPAFEQ
ncbi:hypothetical protein ASD83_04975 [Devosia sp. Root685]|uniref:PRC-barrel domain-containing protein n=1 Tax=Devosia sp. Root685 TaxID=1736587 RepID=UPI0006F82CA4|nr:PRC-barrel domain-containing protein [Devosia sp. Root685]KRA99849.1 hypothetical protein ASD83_04975 [Devosia sp. Root685]